MIRIIKVTRAFKNDVTKYKKHAPEQLKHLASILQELANSNSRSFLGVTPNNRKEYHMESGLLFIYRVDNYILYLERFGLHNEVFNV